MPVFNENAQLDPSQVDDRRGRPSRGAVVGGVGGGLGLIIVLAALLLGVDPSSVLPTDQTASGSRPAATAAAPGPPSSLTANCTVGADANTQQDCRIVAYVNSIQRYWTDEFTRRGARYTPSRTALFTDATETGCGGATTAVRSLLLS